MTRQQGLDLGSVCLLCVMGEREGGGRLLKMRLESRVEKVGVHGRPLS